MKRSSPRSFERSPAVSQSRTSLQGGAAMQNGGTKFHLVLIKPTHYDDDGYPIQWLRSAIPSNTLACLNGLAEDCRKRQVLGPEVDTVISAFDETNRRV